MVYVALLRGINVGGKNKVEMARLRAVFGACGLSGVRSYINSGNVVFSGDGRPASEYVPALEAAIAEEFGLELKLVVRDHAQISELAAALPDAWVNDSTMKCDVMFLWERADEPSVVERLTIKDGIDDVVYVPGALIWRVDREKVTRSGMMKLVGTALYKQMTVRNCNTARKLMQLMQEAADR